MEDTIKKDEEVVEATPEVTEEIASETPAETPVVEAAPVDPDFEDRSLYNCDNCGGEGLVWHDGAHKHELCPQCNGKGKLN